MEEKGPNLTYINHMIDGWEEKTQDRKYFIKHLRVFLDFYKRKYVSTMASYVMKNITNNMSREMQVELIKFNIIKYQVREMVNMALEAGFDPAFFLDIDNIDPYSFPRPTRNAFPTTYRNIMIPILHNWIDEQRRLGKIAPPKVSNNPANEAGNVYCMHRIKSYLFMLGKKRNDIVNALSKLSMKDKLLFVRILEADFETYNSKQADEEGKNRIFLALDANIPINQLLHPESASQFYVNVVIPKIRGYLKEWEDTKVNKKIIGKGFTSEKGTEIPEDIGKHITTFMFKRRSRRKSRRRSKSKTRNKSRRTSRRRSKRKSRRKSRKRSRRKSRRKSRRASRKRSRRKSR